VQGFGKVASALVDLLLAEGGGGEYRSHQPCAGRLCALERAEGPRAVPPESCLTEDVDIVAFSSV
jgi:hypothetical protein